jgi:hypothetical protein
MSCSMIILIPQVLFKVDKRQMRKRKPRLWNLRRGNGV